LRLFRPGRLPASVRGSLGVVILRKDEIEQLFLCEPESFAERRLGNAEFGRNVIGRHLAWCVEVSHPVCCPENRQLIIRKFVSEYAPELPTPQGFPGRLDLVDAQEFEVAKLFLYPISERPERFPLFDGDDSVELPIAKFQPVRDPPSAKYHTQQERVRFVGDDGNSVAVPVGLIRRDGSVVKQLDPREVRQRRLGIEDAPCRDK